jgi:hypothetical protein
MHWSHPEDGSDFLLVNPIHYLLMIKDATPAVMPPSVHIQKILPEWSMVNLDLLFGTPPQKKIYIFPSDSTFLVDFPMEKKTHIQQIQVIHYLIIRHPNWKYLGNKPPCR